MTSHELAKVLLSLPDKPVVISDEGDLNDIMSAEVTPDNEAIRLFRL